MAKRMSGFLLGLALTTCVLTQGESGERIQFEGTIVKMAPKTFESGVLTVYRLVLYKVNRVVAGSYAKETIVVDHLVLKTSELEPYHPGDAVCVSVKRVRHLSPRFNFPGIREPNEKIQWFFVASDGIRSGSCSSQTN